MKQQARTLAIGLSLAALAVGGTAVWADQHMDGHHMGDHSGMMGDTNGDGTITRAEAQARAQQMFAMMDANKDGKLDQADRDARMNAMFDRLDTDKNGQISRAEFAAAHSGPGGMHEGMDHGAMGGSGMMDGPGHEGMMEHGRGHHGGSMGAGMMGPGMMMAMADANKDGAVTQAEFMAAAMQRFDRADANKDGKVTKEERRSAWQAMREQMRARMGTPAAPASPPPAAPATK
jgi:Ca2+-binding EF-hand superfamily protein